MENMRNDPTTPDTRLADWSLKYNPASVNELLRLMLGGNLTGRIWTLHTRVRYFDPENRRAGLPPDVASLVTKMDEGLTNIAILLPFVSTVQEYQRARALVDFPAQVGILVETPAAAVAIEAFCRAGVDFVSIAPHALAQLTLGVDRANSRSAAYYNELDPAVLALIERVIRTCKAHGVPTSICGEATSNPQMIEKLVGFGVTSISCEVDSIDTIRGIVDRTEKRMLLDTVRGADSN